MIHPLLASLVSTLLLSASSVSQEGWPHLRGPRLDGSATAPGLFGEGEIGLRVSWRKALGPAYAGIAIRAGTVVTTFSEGGFDRVIALDAQSGVERWRYELEPIYLGHDGSEDGTVASPTLGGEVAYVVSARGRLVALGLTDGKERWSKDLTRELGASVPEYGFAATPLLEGRLLIVQVGGSDGRFLCGLDAASGALVWSLGEGTLQYTSPIAMDLAGRRQVVVLDEKRILGVAPESGELLWTHAFADEQDAVTSGMATALDGARFCANVSGTIVVFQLSRTDQGFTLEERVRVRELGRTYASPVYAQGRLFGFKSDFLTCCDAESGARLWKSRPPGGRGLIRVEDRLVVYGAQGVVAIVDTDDGEYRELARVQALEHTGYAWPSFADGRVYLRNSAELACVEIVSGLDPKALAEARPPAVEGAFGAFLQALEAVADTAEREARIAAFLSEQTSFPVQEPGLVHFLFQGDVEDVAIAGNMLDGSKPDPLLRVAGTNLHYKSYPIEPGARWEYRFQVDYGDWAADPRNPRSVPAAWGNPMSVVMTPGYEERAGSPEPIDGPRGRLETLSFTSAALENTREVQVYLPPGYEQGEDAYPLLIVHEGPDWLEKGALVDSLDRSIGSHVRPLVVACIAPIEEWWHEGGGTGTEEYLAALAREFVPFLEARYRLSPSPRHRALFGKESFGLTAVLGALLHPETFGMAGTQSLALGDIARHTLFERLESGTKHELAFFVGWNRYEARNRDRGYDYRAESRRVAEALRGKGYSVAGGEFLDGFGWGSWSLHMRELLSALFPLE